MVGKGTYRTKEEKARIVMEVLSNSLTIAEICRKYNVASSAIFKWRDQFIAGGTAAIEHGRSTVKCFTHLWTKYEINYDPCCLLPYKWQQRGYTHLRRN